MSMTETDHCAENALAERMNGILKASMAWTKNSKPKRN